MAAVLRTKADLENTTFQKARAAIHNMSLYRDKRGGSAVMVVEMDQPLPKESLEWLEHLEGIVKVTYINVTEGEEDDVL